MDSEQVETQLLALPFLASLSDATRKTFARTMQTVTKAESVRAGTTLFRQGSQGSNLGCVLLSGEVTIAKTSAPETICVAPALLGEMKQINPEAQRTATVTSVEEIVVMKFNWSKFQDALRQALSESEIKAIETAIQDYAWQHITE